jgi:outer membrane lipoprotein-sorting protein
MFPMKPMKKIALITFILLSTILHGQNAFEIIKRSDEKMRGDSDYSEMKMTIVRPTWKREVSMKAWAMGLDYSIILIISPARDKGSAFLKRKSEIWNWQPSIDRVIKLPPSMMMQSWMGSDFTNDDLVKESSILNDYTHTLVADTVVNGRDSYIIKLIPNEDAAVVWGKIFTYIDKQTYNQMIVKYYDEDDYLVSTMILSEEKDIGGRFLPTKLEMIPAENPRQKTVIEYTVREFNKPINAGFFSLQNMKRIK